MDDTKSEKSVSTPGVIEINPIPLAEKEKTLNMEVENQDDKSSSNMMDDNDAERGKISNVTESVETLMDKSENEQVNSDSIANTHSQQNEKNSEEIEEMDVGIESENLILPTISKDISNLQLLQDNAQSIAATPDTDLEKSSNIADLNENNSMDQGEEHHRSFAEADKEVEEINTSNLNTEDPFESLKNGPNEGSSHLNCSKDDMDNEGTDLNNKQSLVPGDGEDISTNDDNDDGHLQISNENSNDVIAGQFEDLGEGEDIDLCLLPDTERQLSEADIENVISTEEEPERSTAPEIFENSAMQSNDNSVIDITIDLNENLNATDDDNRVPKDNEIIKLMVSVEMSCIKCEKFISCEYKLSENDELKYICSKSCMDEIINDSKYFLTVSMIVLLGIIETEQTCIECNEDKTCKFRYKENNNWKYVCDEPCIDSKYTMKKRHFVIQENSPEIAADNNKCRYCSEEKNCKYYIIQDDEKIFFCNDDCINLLIKEQPETLRLKRSGIRVRNLPKMTDTQDLTENESNKIIARTDEEVEQLRLEREKSFIRSCRQCCQDVIVIQLVVQWETHDFCSEKCLGDYQNIFCKICATCKKDVSHTSMGKFCVRFGFELRQFCTSKCLNDYKLNLKVCAYCQVDIVTQKGIIVQTTDNHFKDFCTMECSKKYWDIVVRKPKFSRICAVCNNLKPVHCEASFDDKEFFFCSTPCFSAFKFVNNVTPDRCDKCLKFFERRSEAYTIYEDQPKLFCSKICLHIFILSSRIVITCEWCKVKKYNFDMIHKSVHPQNTCSLNCLTRSELSRNAISKKESLCDNCSSVKPPQYHLTMSNGTMRNFCTYQCVMTFQSKFKNRTPITLQGNNNNQTNIETGIIPIGLPKRIKHDSSKQSQNKGAQNSQTEEIRVPVITNVTSLAMIGKTRNNNNKNRNKGMITHQREQRELSPISSSRRKAINISSHEPITPIHSVQSPPKIEYKTQVVTIPAKPKSVCNAQVMCKPNLQNKGIHCRPLQVSVECQTDDFLQRKIVIPIPVPFYVPTPMHMFSLPTPTPVPIPLPIPVPIFIPTTRNSATGIMKEIKKIHEKMPTDPYEAELLMMAEMVAGEKKRNDSDSGSDDETAVVEDYTAIMENNQSLNEDLVQMALKMASHDFEEAPVDLESAMTANTISQNPLIEETVVVDNVHHHQMLMLEQQRQIAQETAAPIRGRKRANHTRNYNRNVPTTKRTKRNEPSSVIELPQPAAPREPIEKPDAHMCLKYTFGINAWKQWVITKNADLEKSSIRRKPYKSEILQLTADELNFSLCLFIKEVRKPNGSEYAPDTIYYLVLGIQQYLFVNGRIDNIFTDPYYEQFTICLDEIAKKFSVLYNDTQYIVTRVEEEHLWECKQLGAHSPHVLLSTLMFFNTKHFNLVTVDEHMELSFSHIMKHWKRNPSQSGANKVPGSRNVLLRFYPPQSSLEGNARKKKVYEQQENEENPLRCPVKLYEFYLSKCPESVKTRNDVFYLQPERSCVPDSPVWYSTQALSKDALSRMLHRVKMVKEINIALLTS